MKEKTKTTKKTSENIKAELNALLKLNRKRKLALKKMSKSILEENKKENTIKYSLKIAL